MMKRAANMRIKQSPMSAGERKAPKQVEVWPDLPRSKAGKVLKTDVKAQLKAETSSFQ